MHTATSTRTRRTVGRLAAALGVAFALLPMSGCWSGPVAKGTLANPAPKPSVQSTQAALAASSSIISTMAGVVAPPSQGCYVGIFRPPAPYEMTTLDSYSETISPKVPAILMWYQAWAETQPKDFDQAAAVIDFERGCIPMVTWEPWDPRAADRVKNPDWALQSILDGKYDAYLKRFARKVKNARGPVMLRPMHEMNGYWYPWSGLVNGNTPAKFIRAWRYIHKVFDAEGATNVTWVWTVNWNSVPNSYANRFAAYYPGDTYVDWVGISGFNWGTVRPGSKWMSFSEIYDSPLAYLRTLNKPIAIAEFACVEQGGSKAAWITDAYDRIHYEHPEVKAVIWFDSLEEGNDQVQDWRIDTSKASTAAYRKAVADPYFLGGPASTLSVWLKGLSDKNWAYLRSLPAVY